MEITWTNSFYSLNIGDIVLNSVDNEKYCIVALNECGDTYYNEVILLKKKFIDNISTNSLFNIKDCIIVTSQNDDWFDLTGEHIDILLDFYYKITKLEE